MTWIITATCRLLTGSRVSTPKHPFYQLRTRQAVWRGLPTKSLVGPHKDRSARARMHACTHARTHSLLYPVISRLVVIRSLKLQKLNQKDIQDLIAIQVCISPFHIILPPVTEDVCDIGSFLSYLSAQQPHHGDGLLDWLVWCVGWTPPCAPPRG